MIFDEGFSLPSPFHKSLTSTCKKLKFFTWSYSQHSLNPIQTKTINVTSEEIQSDLGLVCHGEVL